MMEYRVIYFIDDDTRDIGSRFDPWVAYQGDDSREADRAYIDTQYDVANGWTGELGERHEVQLQTSEVFGWATVKTWRRADRDAEKGNAVNEH